MAEESIRIESSDDLKRWLEDKPREWAQAIASRVALRVLPFVGDASRIETAAAERLMLAAFRANSISWAARKYPAVDMAHYASVADDGAYVAPSAGDAAVAAVASAAFATRAASATPASASAASAAYAAARAAETDADATAIWVSISDDGRWLASIEFGRNDGVGSARALMNKRLWLSDVRGRRRPNGTEYRANFPPRARRPFDLMVGNAELKAAGFDVWIEWYRGLLPNNMNRSPTSHFGEKLDIRIATQPDGWWKRDPAEVNADIKRWLEEKDKVPPEQRPTVRQFIVEFLQRRSAPALVNDIVSALEAGEIRVVRKTVIDELSRLVRAGRIRRLERGLYEIAQASKALQAVPNIPSPFEYGFTQDGLITVTSGGMDRIFLPENRSPEDAKNRIEAARTLASDLAEDAASQTFQVRLSYVSSLRRYADRLPTQAGGNVYLADAEARTLRNEFQYDSRDHLDPRFAVRLRTLLEAHQGLRVYFPDLNSFYDDVRSGSLSEPLPLDEIEALQLAIRNFTPDVFHSSVGDSLTEVEVSSGSQRATVSVETNHATGSEVHPPPDPIAEIDPERTAQRARGGALNRLWGTLQKGEQAAKTIDRFEKAYKTFERYIGPLLDWLSKNGG